MLNDFKAVIDQGYLTEVYEFHKTGQAAFMKRPITTFLIEKIHLLFKIELGTAFVWLNFVSLFCASLFLFFLSKTLTKSYLKAYLNSLLFFLCFPIIFMFFVPIYTYDEPLQLVFIFAALLAFFKQKQVLFLILFTVSVFVRESSLLLLPAIFVLKFPSVRLSTIFSVVKANLMHVLFLVSPAIVYFGAIKIYVNYFNIQQVEAQENAIRWMCLLQNFESDKSVFESIAAFFLVLLIPVYFIVTTKSTELFTSKNKGLVKAFIITLVVNTLIAYSMTKVREARILMLPLVFLWPVFSAVFFSKIKIFFISKNWINFLKNPIIVLSFLVLMCFNYYLAFLKYETTIGNEKHHVFKYYFFALLTVFFIHVCLSIANKQKKQLQNETAFKIN
ncbi:MAG: hypothetical protein RIT10_1800 [Bacteroidota bacterium]